MSEEKKKFNLGEELHSLKTMTEIELSNFQIELETSIALLETQLSCYEDNIVMEEPGKNDLWYKQALFVFHGKKLLLRKVSSLLGEVTPMELFLNALKANEIPHDVRRLPKQTVSISLLGPDTRVALLFRHDEFINVG